jgi:hypothetical protein
VEELKLAIDVLHSSQTLVFTIWGLFATAILGLLGYVLGGKTPVPGRGKIALGVAFLVFATSNAYGLWVEESICYAASRVVASYASMSSPIPAPQTSAASAAWTPSSGMRPTLLKLSVVSSPGWVVGFQIALSISALLAIAFAYLHDSKSERAAKDGQAKDGAPGNAKLNPQPTVV